MGYKITFLPENKVIEIMPGTDLLTAAILAQVDLASGCAGEGTCGRCKLIRKEGDFNYNPSSWLSLDEKEQGYILACQTTVNSNAVVEVPTEARVEQIQIVDQLTQFTTESVSPSPDRPEEVIFRHSPLIHKSFLTLTPPTLTDNIPDWERIVRSITAKYISSIPEISLSLLRRLPNLLRQADWQVTFTLLNFGTVGRIIQIEPGNTENESYGIAVDIGTTTVVAYLVNLNSGQVIDSKSTYNRQVVYGEDVITRIMYTETQPDGLEKLNHCIISLIDGLIVDLIRDKQISLQNVLAVQVAGNTTMMHLLLRIPPSTIRREPYVPVINKLPIVHATEVGIHINPRGIVSCVPGVASYIGGDITAGVLACGMYNSVTLSLLIDLGTNGEIVLGNRDWLIACACSAGPAFEGVGIKNGIRAINGAIQKIKLTEDNSNVLYDTIGNYTPRGICGTGLVDIPAELLIRKIINRAGNFIPGSSPLIRRYEEGWEFVIVPARESATGQDIALTESDLKALIHSKGAVYWGMSVLLEELNLSFDNIARIYISGGFGTYLDVEKAIIIGLLPDLPRERFVFIGNSSITGAKMYLLSEQARVMAEQISRKMTYIELSVNPKFMNEYTSSLFLPHTNIDLFPTVKKLLE